MVVEVPVALRSNPPQEIADLVDRRSQIVIFANQTIRIGNVQLSLASLFGEFTDGSR